MNNPKFINIIKVPRFENRHGFSTNPKRSALMAKIKGRSTKPELILRKALWHFGFRYRLHVKTLTGKPDILILKYNIVIFVDGEFWHGYNWEKKREKIQANRGFWIPKIERNMQRDVENVLKLTNLGFVVLRFWEHEIKKNLNECIEKITFYTK